MTIRLIRRPKGLGEPLGRYSHVGIGVGNIVAIAGQVGINQDGQLVGPDLPSQLRQAFVNVGAALAAASCDYTDILRMTTYLVNSDLIEEFMNERAKVFTEIFPSGEYPPNTLVIISRLVEPELLIEVEALAVSTK
ncbi:MAG TPA: RidA family protein [Acidimicrobiales bacterium]|nr:RidA family protein [Acidimicrobiales bacterium]